MDRKGAQALTRLLAARHGSVPEVAAVRPLKATNAAPIFRWLGIEPPTPQSTTSTGPERVLGTTAP